MFAILSAGWSAWLLILASIIAFTLIIERFLSLRRDKVLPPKLLDEVVNVFKTNGANLPLIESLEAGSPLGRVLAAGLRHVNTSRDVMKESIEQAGRVATHDLERFLTTLGTVASLAPLLGLFGTVIGMIEMFGASNGGGANPTQLGHGISVALYNTAFGLAVAMPALIFYRYFRGLVDSFIVEMEQQALKFVDIVDKTHARRQTRKDYHELR